MDAVALMSTTTAAYAANSSSSLEEDSLVVAYPRAATVFAAVCASLFTVVGIAGTVTVATTISPL